MNMLCRNSKTSAEVMSYDKRDNEIAISRSAGRSIYYLAKKYNLSPQRISQLLKRFPAENEHGREMIRHKRSTATQQRVEAMKAAVDVRREANVRARELVMKMSDTTRERDIGASAGFAQNTVSRLLIAAGKRRGWARLMSREDISLLERLPISYPICKKTRESLERLRAAGLVKSGVRTIGGESVLSSYRGAGWLSYHDESDQESVEVLLSEAAAKVARAEAETAAALSELALWRERALTDDLTGVATRAAFTERLSVETARALRSNTPLIMLYVDLDKFKLVNDEAGHQAGDEILKKTATALRESVRASDLVARIGGDEFALLLPGAHVAAAEALTARLRRRVTEATGLNVSVGIVEYDRKKMTLEQFVAAADAAMYVNKRTRSNS